MNPPQSEMTNLFTHLPSLLHVLSEGAKFSIVVTDNKGGIKFWSRQTIKQTGRNAAIGENLLGRDALRKQPEKLNLIRALIKKQREFDAEILHTNFTPEELREINGEETKIYMPGRLIGRVLADPNTNETIGRMIINIQHSPEGAGELAHHLITPLVNFGHLNMVGKREAKANSSLLQAHSELLKIISKIENPKIREQTENALGHVENAAAHLDENRKPLGFMAGTAKKLENLITMFTSQGMNPPQKTLVSNEITHAVSMLPQDTNVKLEVNSEAPVKIEQAGLHMAVFNAISNARKAGAENVGIKVDKKGNKIIIKISNDGKPMESHALSGFKIVGRMTTGKGTGRGLGFISQYASRHKGEFSVRNLRKRQKKGKHSVEYTLKLPIARK
ncbi:hypothetical protein HY993_02970 [Candidatus Micrarchaeota archaeon]|nr:hypothetical protein [Candidatus Micrarchaeota archaeon]